MYFWLWAQGQVSSGSRDSLLLSCVWLDQVHKFQIKIIRINFFHFITLASSKFFLFKFKNIFSEKEEETNVEPRLRLCLFLLTHCFGKQFITPQWKKITTVHASFYLSVHFKHDYVHSLFTRSCQATTKYQDFKINFEEQKFHKIRNHRSSNPKQMSDFSFTSFFK